MTIFVIRALTVVGLGFAFFTSVDLATASRLPWWNYTFMWAVLLMAGSIVGAFFALRSNP